MLATAGAAEAFTLIARLRDWRHPVVVHPQFTEPEVALRTAGHTPDQVVLTHADGFRLRPDAVPDDADLVVIGNPTNPTGVRHSADAVRSLTRDGRLVVVDEAFLDDDVETLADERHAGLVVLRSLTKLWSIPGIRAGYVLAEPHVVDELRARQTPWSVSAPAIAALIATSTDAGAATRPAHGRTSSTAGAATSSTDWPSWASRPSPAPRRTSSPEPAREAGKPCGAWVSRSAGPTPSPDWTTSGSGSAPAGRPSPTTS